MSTGLLDDDDHDKIQILGALLESRLPALGLDSDTYGAYILPLLHYPPTTSKSALILEGNNEDDEEWDEVLDLLRASSETHSDDKQSFCDLRSDIVKLWNHHLVQRNEKVKEHNEMKLKELSDQLVKEAQVAQVAAELEQKDKKSNSILNKDEATKALIERYGYAENDSDDERVAKGSGNADDVILTNKEHAAQMEREKALDLRSKKTTSKKEEQKKTADVRKLKEETKEQRRKRAIKGERKR
jgi:hypothetical protein